MTTTAARSLRPLWSSPRLPSYVACLAGLAFTRLLRQYPFGDAVAPATYTFLAVAFVLLLALWRRPSRAAIPVGLMLLLWAIPLSFSLAPGSSWASVTWYPVILAVVMLSALSPVFLLTTTAVMALDNAGALVILKNDLTGSQTSGTVPYFLGFVGVVGSCLWFALAYRVAAKSRWGAVSIAGSVCIASLCAWMVLASGARAAVLGLVIAGISGLVIRRISLGSRNSRRRLLLALVGLIIATGLWDVGLTRFYSPPSTSTILPVLSARTGAAVSEIDRGTGSMSTRLQFWREALNATLARPMGHGPGSYAYVIHTYQDRPMLWSASPHNFVALAGVEGGIAGALGLVVLIVLAATRAARSRPGILATLLGSVVVMSLDVFSSQPVQGLLWWAVLGAALSVQPPDSRRTAPVRGRAYRLALLLPVLILGSFASARLNLPCEVGCDPLERFAGYPDKLGALLRTLADRPTDPRWDRWLSLYPTSFALDKALADAKLSGGDYSGYLALVRRYPYQSVDNYLVLLPHLPADEAANVAECGLRNFFSGQTIWRDHRSSGGELAAAREEFEKVQARSVAVGETTTTGICDTPQLPVP